MLKNVSDDSLMSRHRPSRLNMPSISDQILDSAGLKNTGDGFFNDALSDFKSKRRPMTADPEDLMNDPFFSKVCSFKLFPLPYLKCLNVLSN